MILDLPAAVEHAAPLLAGEGMGDRVVHRVGDGLADDLGTEAWDVVFVSSLVHHFDDATNRAFAKKIARALRPGGVYVIQELIRASPPAAGQIGALLDLYFALTSEAGTWSFEEMADWQREAGLRPLRPLKFRTVPGNGQQSAVKPEGENQGREGQQGRQGRGTAGTPPPELFPGVPEVPEVPGSRRPRARQPAGYPTGSPEGTRRSSPPARRA